MLKPLLLVDKLSVSFAGKRVVRDISFEVRPGETLGIIGESGSGKSVTALTIAHLLPFNASRCAEVLEFVGVDLLTASPEAVDELRGIGWAVIFQDPTGSFNPVKTVAWHIQAVFRRRSRKRPATAQPSALDLLASVGIKSPERVLASFPSELSGGMLQRVLIALVTALEPRLIIADEPTTNLDKVIEN